MFLDIKYMALEAVKFEKPSSCDIINVCLIIRLFCNIYAILANSRYFCDKIQTQVFSINNQFNRFLSWSISQADSSTYFEANRIF